MPVIVLEGKVLEADLGLEVALPLRRGEPPPHGVGCLEQRRRHGNLKEVKMCTLHIAQLP